MIEGCIMLNGGISQKFHWFVILKTTNNKDKRIKDNFLFACALKTFASLKKYFNLFKIDTVYYI